MSKIIIFGNSGSGKSTLAKTISNKLNAGHLDLDTVAWKSSTPPQRMPIAQSIAKMSQVIENSENWVIEGGYADLISAIIHEADEIVFLDLDIQTCTKNCKNRPYESHKYSSKEAQDKNLDMLLSWIQEYYIRDDTFSRKAHIELFENFNGKKTKYTSNERE